MCRNPGQDGGEGRADTDVGHDDRQGRHDPGRDATGPSGPRPGPNKMRIVSCAVCGREVRRVQSLRTASGREELRRPPGSFPGCLGEPMKSVERQPQLSFGVGPEGPGALGADSRFRECGRPRDARASRPGRAPRARTGLGPALRLCPRGGWPPQQETPRRSPRLSLRSMPSHTPRDCRTPAILADSPDSVDAPFAPPRNGPASASGPARVLRSLGFSTCSTVRQGDPMVRSPPNLERRLGSCGAAGPDQAPEGAPRLRSRHRVGPARRPSNWKAGETVHPTRL